MRDFSFTLRAVQLDLARQMETVDFIKRFIDFAAANGFNALALYLEGRVRTPSFPYPAKSESYTVEEMQEIVSHAGAKGVEIIPVVSPLGHAELFLKHPEMESLAEARPPFKGRFGSSSREVFCPSKPGTFGFFQTYFRELSEIFPSRWFHAGCDEAWDMACCDLCRKRLQEGETQADLFSKHLLEIHRILSGELGKRMIVWDDMFEYYPEALDAMPRDMVMACWQYQGRVDVARAHFVNRLVVDQLPNYEAMGFDYLICPADYTLHNAESFTAYGARHRPLGGLLTTWEKSDSFLLQSMPLIACVGRLWESGRAGNVATHLKAVVADLFGERGELFFQAIQSLCNGGLYAERRTTPDHFLTRGENNLDYGRRGLVEVLLALLPDYLPRVKPSSRPILEEMLLSLRSEQAASMLGELLPEFFKGELDAAEGEARLNEICGRLEAIARERVAMWHCVRPSVVPCRMETLYAAYLANLRQIPALAREHGILTVHFLLPDQYSAQRVTLSIRYADGDACEPVASGVFKELQVFDCLYSKIFLISKERIPVSLKVETSGFGGQGFTFFEAENSRGRFIPEAVMQVEGIVTDPENLLCHDWRWAFAGERNTLEVYLDSARAAANHGFEVKLRQENRAPERALEKEPLTEETYRAISNVS